MKERRETIELPVEYSAKVFIDLEEKTSYNQISGRTHQCLVQAHKGHSIFFRGFILCRLNPEKKTKL